MATGPAASRLQVLVLVLFFLMVQFGSADQTIRAETGQNVILPCEAAKNKNDIILDWSKPDLGKNDQVALYRDHRLDKVDQNPSYKGRVALQDIEMKNRNVSLVLKNVTINDTGKYECRVHPRDGNRRKRSELDNEPICNVILLVSAPGNKGGQKKDGGNEEGKENDGGTNTALIVGLSVSAVLALFAVLGFLLYYKRRRSSQQQNQPPAAAAELQAMNVENHPEPEM